MKTSIVFALEMISCASVSKLIFPQYNMVPNWNNGSRTRNYPDIIITFNPN